MPSLRCSVTAATTILAALACAPSAALGQTVATAGPATAPPAQSPAPKLIPTSQWSVRLEPQVWYVAPAGDLTMPGSASGTPPVQLEMLDAEEPEASAAGQVTIRIPQNQENRWGTDDFWKTGWFFSVGGASFSGDTTGTAPAGGFTIGSIAVAGSAAVSTSFEWSTFHAMAGKWITGSDFGTGGDVHIDLYAVAGLRVHTQDITISSGGGSTTASESFGAALVGVRLDVKFPCGFAADVNVNANYWPGDASCTGVEISPTFTWRPTANLGVQLGYRLLIANCESGEEGDADYYKFDGSLAGIYAGVEIRF